jgi:hypothetical protein
MSPPGFVGMDYVIIFAAMKFTGHSEAGCGSDLVLSQWSLCQEKAMVVSINNTPYFQNGEIFFSFLKIYAGGKLASLIIRQNLLILSPNK